MPITSHFGTMDYVVFGICLCVSAMIGVYHRLASSKKGTTEEYLMADKSMNVLPVAFSLTASSMSSVFLIGVTEEAYVYGTQYALINVGFLLGTVLVGIVYLPVFFKLQVTSAYSYLELRFGRIARLAASASFIILMVLYMSVALFAPSMALSAVTGFSVRASVFSVGAVCTFYSTVGGMKAVLWSSLFQTCLVTATLLGIIIRGLIDYEGFGQIWRIAEAGKRINFFDFRTDPTVRLTFWTQTIGGMFNYLSVFGVNQTQVQTLLTVNSLQKSQVALFLNYTVRLFLSLSTVFAGIIMYCKYSDCDPCESKRILSTDQVLPLFVMDYLAFFPGLAGLLISGIFSATLSVVSSSTNALAAVVLENFAKPAFAGWFENSATDWKITILLQVLVCVFGTLAIAFSFFVAKLDGILQVTFTIWGILGGPLLGLFSVGMLCPRSTEKSAIIGFATAIIFSSWMGIGAYMYRPHQTALPVSVEGCEAMSNDSIFFTVNSSIKTESVGFASQERTFQLLQEASDNTSLFNKLSISDPSESITDIFYLYRVSFMWYTPSGFFIVMVVGILIGFCEKKRKINPDLLSPVCMYWCLNSTDEESESDVLISRGFNKE